MLADSGVISGLPYPRVQVHFSLNESKDFGQAVGKSETEETVELDIVRL